ncbi:MAG: MiaB-like tRNA modifying enzyme [Acidobacteria bacterium]|nr:MiaB-like tRNA modifying enzyme [Acidobacteriota bacterium]
MKFCVLTFGCRANQADSFRIEEELCGRGHAAAPRESAELAVVNTCAVTAAAEHSARQAIRRLARENPAVRIAVTGCYATRRGDALDRLPNVVALVPNAEKERLVEAIDDRPASSGAAAAGILGPGARGRTIYPLQVQTGCDERCTYCVVPATRGRSASRPAGAVAEEARRLAAAGYREVILTGVHLGAWGRDLAPARGLVELLDALDAIPVVFRLSSLEPMDCTSGIVDRLARPGSRFAPHLHLPLQHASDRVLRLMRRPYTFDDFRRLSDTVGSRLPHAAIGTDVIAGFPGETGADFERLERALDELPLAYVHVFAYSDRPGTAAAGLGPKVPADVVRARAGRLRERAALVRRRFEEGQAGATRPALTLGDGTTALTDNYLKVRIEPGRRRNERVRIHVGSGTPLRGEVVA